MIRFLKAFLGMLLNDTFSFFSFFSFGALFSFFSFGALFWPFLDLMLKVILLFDTAGDVKAYSRSESFSTINQFYPSL